MTIAVCIKWALPTVESDQRFAGISYADQAALEFALRIAAVTNDRVLVVTAGLIGSEKALREAIACGAQRAIRIDISPTANSATIAVALADVVRGSSSIWCGDYSADRGSGAVPAFIAAELDIGQALGLIDITLPISPEDMTIAGVRRLDGGRREILSICGPAVISVEGSVARLRRASLKATMSSAQQEIEVVWAASPHNNVVELRPYRPRARVVNAPLGNSALDRVRHIIDTSNTKAHGETVHLEPQDAALMIMQALRQWGYLP